MHTRLRIAIAHEWLSARAGSEKTFEVLAGAFPEADLYALSRDPQVAFDFGGRDVRTTFLDRSRWLRNRRALTLPLMPLAWRLAGRGATYDVVLTSSHACVKGFAAGRRALHLCYVHSPMRYAWLPDVDSRTRARQVPRAALRTMARWDRESTRWVDAFACNSNAVRERIRAFYGRESDVIFPPVATDFYSPVQGSREDRALVVSRLVPYKRVDVAIEACAIAEMPLTVAGVGPDRDRLVECASRVGADVEFIGAPSDIELRELYRRARLLVFPAEEDFGIIPVEAQSAGMPVIALARGGARDTVVDGVTGALVASGTPAAFADAISQWRHRDVDNAACSANARRFDTSEFVEHVRAWVRREAGRV